MTERFYTTSTAFLEALAEAGVQYIFANLGSDHPGLIEALAQAKADGRAGDLPQVIICPHEMVAFSAAQLAALVSRSPQAVIVHVDVGTQNMGGAISNARTQPCPGAGLRGRFPVHHARRAARQPQRVHPLDPGRPRPARHHARPRQVRQRDPLRRRRQAAGAPRDPDRRERAAGPVYLVGPREVMEQPLEPYTVDAADYRPVEPAALTPEVTAEIGRALAAARNPLIITGHLGRDPEAVPELVELADLLAIPVIESGAFRMNFPADHPMHRGWQFTTTEQNPLLAAADVILIVDCDVPYIELNSRPSPDAEIYVIDIDPLKQGMSLWHVPARRSAAANSKVALGQIASLRSGQWF